jgi:hypothetical protein
VPKVITRSLYPECIANLKLPIDAFYRESRSGVNIAKRNITTGLFGLVVVQKCWLGVFSPTSALFKKKSYFFSRTFSKVATFEIQRFKISVSCFSSTYRIKGILFSILSLSVPLSGEPDDGPDKDSIENK